MAAVGAGKRAVVEAGMAPGETAPVVAELLKFFGASPDRRSGLKAKDEVGWDALHLAASHGHLAVCTLLLDAGFEDSPDADGFTAKELAARRGHNAVAEALK